MDRLAAMQTFVTVVDSGSISAAAKRLGVGQPAVSKSLAALERHLGVSLMARSTRAHVLTDPGRRFLAHARAVLDEAEAAEAAARDEAAALTGILRVAAPPAYANEILIPALGSFRAQHPAIMLDLILDDRRVDLMSEGIDLALRGGAIADSSIIARCFDRPRRIVVASSAWLNDHAAPAHPRDLLGQPWIEYAAWHGNAWRFVRGRSNDTLTFTPTLRVSPAEALRVAVCCGLGLAIVSERMVQRDLALGTLVRLLPDWELPAGEMWLLSPAGRRMSARARAFGSWLDTVVAGLAAGAATA